jgi:hypothetical protein
MNVLKYLQRNGIRLTEMILKNDETYGNDLILSYA